VESQECDVTRPRAPWSRSPSPPRGTSDRRMSP
jgi:hypothetical protein